MELDELVKLDAFKALREELIDPVAASTAPESRHPPKQTSSGENLTYSEPE
jgi:hypothetical protein